SSLKRASSNTRAQRDSLIVLLTARTARRSRRSGQYDPVVPLERDQRESFCRVAVAGTSNRTHPTGTHTIAPLRHHARARAKARQSSATSPGRPACWGGAPAVFPPILH